MMPGAKTQFLAAAALLLLAVAGTGATGGQRCITYPSDAVKSDWSTLNKTCWVKIRSHIKEELRASVTYLKLGSNFLQASNFRPNVAKMLLEHAAEERQHAKGLIDYLLMRGEKEITDPLNPDKKLPSDFDKLHIGELKPNMPSPGPINVMVALEKALEIEKKVRDAFQEIIKECESSTENDYHASDFLTGNYLDEQHKGVRELIGHLSTLDRLQQTSASRTFAEFEFDRALSH